MTNQAYKKIVGIPMSTSCALLVADLFLFCYERDFMLSLSDDKKSEVIEAFNCTSRYLDDQLSTDNTFFDSMVNHIYPSELQLNKANVSDTEASFYAPNFGEVEGGHIGLGLSVRPSFCPTVCLSVILGS